MVNSTFSHSVVKELPPSFRNLSELISLREKLKHNAIVSSTESLQLLRFIYLFANASLLCLSLELRGAFF